MDNASLSLPPLVLTPGEVDLATLRRVHAGGVQLALDPSARAGLLAAQATVRRIVDAGEVVYGINTGFGKLAQTTIPPERLAELQRNLVLSHSAGTGEPLPDGVVRLVLATKAVSLARGHSGIAPEIVDALLALCNAGLLPRIPSKGSVGASGDLAPLAHLACVLIGEGEVTAPDGAVIGGAEALSRIGLAPFVLGPKEGLALLNGTQVSTALALAGLFGAEDVFAAGLMAGALSLEAIQGSIKPFDARIHAARGQPGQIAVAGAVRSAARRQRDHPLARRLRPRAGPVLAALRAAGDGRLPRQPRACGARAAHRGQRRVRQPAGVRQRRRDLRRQLPRRAGGLRGRHHRARGRRDRRHLRAPHGPAARQRPLGPAALPGARRRRQLRLHDRAGHGRGAGLREQVARASGQRRQPADLGQPGRPCRRWPPSRAARLAEMVENTAVVVGIEAMAAAQGIELKRGPKSPRRCSKPSSPPSASASPSSTRTASSLPTSRPCASGPARAAGPTPCKPSCPARPEQHSLRHRKETSP